MNSQQIDPRRRFVKELADGDNIEEVYLVVGQATAGQPQRQPVSAAGAARPHRRRSAPGSGTRGEHLFRSFEDGDFLLVKGKVQLFQGALQMILSHLDRVDTDKVELADFLPHTEQDVSKLYERLRGFLLQAEQSAPARPGRMLPDGRGFLARLLPGARPASATITPISAACWSTSSRCWTPPTACCRSIPNWIATCC